MKRLILIVVLMLIKSTLGINLQIQNPLVNSDLSKFVCKITNDIIKTSTQTQDVLIGSMDRKSRISVVNDTVTCLSEISPVVITNFRKPAMEKSLRKATVIILELDNADLKTIQLLVGTHHGGSVWHHMAKVICIVPKTMEMRQRTTILIALKFFGFLNVAVIHQTESGTIRFEVFDSRLVYGLNEANASVMFPNKLKNMQGHQLKIAVFNESPRVEVVHSHVSAPMIHFLKAVSKARNSTFEVTILEDLMLINQLWSNREMDLTLNTALVMDSSEPKLLTYEEDSYCALVPLPPKYPLFQMILIEPFDSLTWLLMLLSLIASVAIWWMFRGRGAVDSPWLLAYGMIVMFIGQGVEFSRKNRLVLVILLQLIIVVIFVLKNAYEGVITSFMIEPMHDDRLKTFDDVLGSKYDIVMDQLFAASMNDTEEFKIHSFRFIIRYINATDTFSSRVLEHKHVLILPCNYAEHYTYNKLLDGTKLLDYYYFLPSRFLSYFIRLDTSYSNPFVQVLQHLMDLCFEAGLPQVWKVFESQDVISMSKNQNIDEPVYLELKDLVQVFSILVIGYAISTAALLVEIFFHDALSKLSLAYLARKLKNKVNQMSYKRKQPSDVKYQRGALYYIIHRHQKLKRLRPKKLKVREIFVRPINSEE